jgi:hypothetical protein
MGARFWLQTVPLVGLAALVTVGGSAIGRAVAGPAVIAIAAAVALLAYAGALTFRRSRMDGGLHLGFSLAAGISGPPVGPFMPDRWALPRPRRLSRSSLRRCLAKPTALSAQLFTPVDAAWLLIAMMIASTVAGFWPEYGSSPAPSSCSSSGAAGGLVRRLDSDPPPLAAVDLPAGLVPLPGAR